MAWHDIETFMVHWYRDSAVAAWDDCTELEQELDALDSVGHLWETPEERAINAEMHEDLMDMLSFTADELRPQLRLAASSRQAAFSLKR